MDTKALANRLSGLIAFLAPTYFAWTVFAQHIPQNIATWVMITINNLIGVVLVYKSGNKQPWLNLGWLFSSSLVVAAIIISGSPLSWGLVEVLSSVLCGVAIFFWVAYGPRIALFGYVAAVLVSSIPLIVDYYHIPQPDTAWLFASTIFSCLLAWYGAKERDLAHVLVPIFMLGLNAVILALCFL